MEYHNPMNIRTDSLFLNKRPINKIRDPCDLIRKPFVSEFSFRQVLPCTNHTEIIRSPNTPGETKTTREARRAAINFSQQFRPTRAPLLYIFLISAFCSCCARSFSIPIVFPAPRKTRAPSRTFFPSRPSEFPRTSTFHRAPG